MMPLAEMACAVLTTSDSREKTILSRRLAAQWFEHRHADLPVEIGTASPPDMPARPDKPELLAPRDVPRRKTGSEVRPQCAFACRGPYRAKCGRSALGPDCAI